MLAGVARHVQANTPTTYLNRQKRQCMFDTPSIAVVVSHAAAGASNKQQKYQAKETAAVSTRMVVDCMLLTGECKYHLCTAHQVQR